MGKSISNGVLDAALQYLEDNADDLAVCDTEPASYADATTNKGSGGDRLGHIAIDSSDFTGPVDGDTNGRKTTVGAQTSITVDVTGTADHVALTYSTGTELLLVTTISNSQTVTATNTMDTSAFDIEIADPT